MDVVALIARALLAGVLAAAGAAKLRDLDGSREAMAGFGVAPAFAPAAGLLLPLAELALAVALVVPALVTAAGLLALGLLTAMSVAVARLLIRGEAPDCHCFGTLHSRPVDRATLARSVTLAILAAFVAAQGAGAVVAEIGPFGLEAVVPLVAGVGAGFAARHHEPRQPPLFADAPPPGSQAPRFELPHAGGGRSSLDSLLARGPAVLLVFVDPGCRPCKALLTSLSRWQDTLRERLSIAVISRGESEANLALCRSTGLPDLLLQSDSEVSHAYGVLPTPSAVLVSPQGTIASTPAAGALAIEELMRFGVESVPAGEPARA